MRAVAVVLAIILALLAAPVMAQPATTMIVMDGSGSMWGRIDGRPKLEIARETAASVLAGIPDQQSLGLMAYGHRARGDCADIEVIVAPGPGSADAIADAVDAMRFQGKTPITEAVRQAAEALRFTEAPATIVLVTDGIETCSADPCAVATELEAAGVDFTAHVIGFGLTEDDGRQVACIAENTGGRYIQAIDADGLAEALGAAVGGDVAAAPEAEPLPKSRHFPGEAMMADVALVPTGRSFGEPVASPVEPAFAEDGTIAQCQALCTADGACGSWRYEPQGSYFVDHARCFLYSPATEFTASFQPEGEDWASGMKEGVIGLTRPYVAIGATGIAATLSVPEPIVPRSEFTVLWAGPAGESDWVDIVPVGYTELSGELSYFYVNDTIEDGDPPEGAGTLTAPAEPGRYELRYVLGRELDRRVIHTVQVTVGGDVADSDETPAGQPVEATFSVDDGGLELAVTWSAVPVEGQDLPPEAWAMQEGIAGPVTELFLPGEYDVLGEAGDTVYAGRVRITPEGPNAFVIPYSPTLSPAGEDQIAEAPAPADYVCDSADPCAHDDPTGLSFTLPAGWRAEAPFFYETAAGVRSERPTVAFTDAGGERTIVLNPIRWSEGNGTCSLSAAGELCVVGQPDGEALLAYSTILPSLRFAP